MSASVLKALPRKKFDIKQKGQEVLNYAPEFCLKLTYRYLLKADHVRDENSQFWSQGHDLNKLGRGPLDNAAYQISRLMV